MWPSMRLCERSGLSERGWRGRIASTEGLAKISAFIREKGLNAMPRAHGYQLYENWERDIMQQDKFQLRLFVATFEPI